MKTSARFLALVAVVSLAKPAFLHAQTSLPTGAADLDGARAQYTQGLAAIRADRETKLAPMRAPHLARLDQLQKDAATIGDAPGALAAQTERERMAAGTELTEPQRKDLPPAILAIRVRYEQDAQPVMAESARFEETLRKRYAATLEDLQRRYVQRNELDKAGAVKAELATLPGGAGVSAPDAKTPAKLPPLGSGTLAAGRPGGRLLLDKEHERKWKPVNGKWKIENGVMTGSGESTTTYAETLTPPFTLKFKIKVLDGMRPRVRVGPVAFANEGYETTFGLYCVGFDGEKRFPYERNKVYDVSLVASHKSFELYVDNKLVDSVAGFKNRVEKLDFSAGDGYSKGRVEYSEIVVTK